MGVGAGVGTKAWLVIACACVGVNACADVLGDFPQAHPEDGGVVDGAADVSVVDSGRPDSTMGKDAPPDTSSSPDVARGDEPDAPVQDTAVPDGADAQDTAIADTGGPLDSSVPVDSGADAREAGCEAGSKTCGGACVSVDDPAYGCAAASCAPCSLANATAQCSAGSCAVAGCTGAFLDCDGIAANGCEVDGSDDPMHCGTCPTSCSGGTCSSGACTQAVCTPPMANCAPDSGLGCPVNTSTDPQNCGICGDLCAPINGSATCASSLCSFSCNAGHAHCPGSPNSSGCGTVTSSDGANCGVCGNACGVGLQCVSSSCTCTAQSCSNGCCTSGTTCALGVVSSCGSSCTNCTAVLQNVTGPLCTGSGGCDYTACAAGHADADGNRANGCESLAPTGSADAASLITWLVADVGFGGGSWIDQSGGGANGACSVGGNCPVVVSGAINGHTALGFNGTALVQLTEGAVAQHKYASTSGYTIFVVALPGTSSQSYARMVTLTGALPLRAVKIQNDPTDGVAWQVLDNSGYYLGATSSAWSGSWEQIEAATNSNNVASLWINEALQTNGVPVGAPKPGYMSGGDLNTSYLGYDPAASTTKFVGQIAEVFIYGVLVSPTTTTQMQAYLHTRYGL